MCLCIVLSFYFGCDRGLVLALFISLIFILMLRFTAGFLLWFIIIAVILLVAYGQFLYAFKNDIFL